MNTAQCKTFIEHLASMVGAPLIGKVASPAFGGSGSGSGLEDVAAATGRGSSRSSGCCCGDEVVEATAASREPIADEPEAEEIVLFSRPWDAPVGVAELAVGR